MSTTIVEQGIDWQILWDGCPSCGAPAPCPKWIVTDTLSCELYPCLCDQTKAEAYERVGIDDPACWWRDKKRPGRLASRCPCWGRARDDRLPRDCCSRHDANPTYLVEVPAVEAATGSTSTGEAPEHTVARTAAGSTTGTPLAYTRRYTPEQVTCDCRTPWDGSKVATGIHCVQCHQNWKSASVMAVHQRWVTDHCRAPQSIVDCDTGRPLLAATRVGDFVVWNFNFSRSL
jgi:hypothetical protein